MSASEIILYVLRHGWLWPGEFLLRPWVVMHRSKQQPWGEFGSAMLGGMIWGAALGTLVWLTGVPVAAVWVLALATLASTAVTFAFAGTGAVAVASAVAFAIAVAFAVSVTFAGDGAFAGTIAFAVAFAGAFAVAGNVAGAGLFAGSDSFAGAGIYIILLGWTGVALGLWLGPFWILGLVALGGILLTVSVAVLGLTSLKSQTEVLAHLTVVLSLFVLLPASALGLLPYGNPGDGLVWGVAGAAALAFGVFGRWGMEPIAQYRKKQRDAGSAWLSGLWILFPLLALATLHSDTGNPMLNERLDIIAYCLLVTPLVISGLFAYPLVALSSLIAYRASQAKRFDLARFRNGLPFRWQTFAWPLPRLADWLVMVEREKGMGQAILAILVLQDETLQGRAASRAASQLARNPQTALALAGQVARQGNQTARASLALTGPAARSVVALPGVDEKQDKEIPWLLVDRVPPIRSRILLFIGEASAPDKVWSTFDAARRKPLKERLKYCLEELRLCPDFQDAVQYGELLGYLQLCAAAFNLADLTRLPRPAPLDEEPYLAWLSPDWEHLAWLAPGRALLAQLVTALGNLNEYPSLRTVAARRDWLQALSTRLVTLKEGRDDNSLLPSFWPEIRSEILDVWLTVLAREAQQPREWLRLEVEQAEDHLALGSQQVGLILRNPTDQLARGLRLNIEETGEGLFWQSREHQLRLLEGRETLRVELPVTADSPGDYIVRGELEARDLEERLCRFPFVLRLSVAAQGRRYQTCSIQPYETGSGLGSDRTFVGRGDLIEWLAAQWRSPDTSQGVVLVGQRRIGKTSLLNFLERHGLPQTPLVAVKADLQACADEYQFLDRAAARIAGRLGLPTVVLDQSAPYRAFERFLDLTAPALAGRRILLMVDEANLLPQRFNTTHLPGFLRSLMQGDYPLMVMFCGTHALREGARDYDSILFNTARFRTISYLTEAEAEEVLERPARDYLEFDTSTLRRGYALTHGQPLLLQTLGALTIEDFNAEARQGRPRSTFVSPADLDRAAEQLVRGETSPVFDEHWEHSSLDTRLHLSALAWATDEDNRHRMDAPGLRKAMEDAGLRAGTASATSAILDSLTAEQVLVEEGPTYRYAVPLYRRWIAWRHPPRKLQVAQGE